MVEKRNSTFQMRAEFQKAFINELKKWKIPYQKFPDRYEFEFQYDNVVHKITLFITEWNSLEEQLFMLNEFPYVKSFQNIQDRTIGKIMWK